MNPFFQQLILNTVNKSVKQPKGPRRKRNYNLEKEVSKYKITILHLLRDSFLLSIGVVSAGFGLKSFLLPNSFIDGGVTGISLLLTNITKFNLPFLIVVINIPFIIMGFKQVGKAFAIRSAIAILGLALAITFIEYPVITSDKLLVAVFGGIFLGAGIGFAIRGGGVLDGTEILAISLSKKTGLTIGDIILIFNIIIFSFAAYVLSVEVALYSILTYLAASKMVDYIIVGFEEYTGVTIISSHSEELRVMIIEKLGHGVTIYNGKRGFGKKGDNLNPTNIIYTVVTRLEIGKLQTEVKKIDEAAFIVMNPVKDTAGGMIKKKFSLK